ncbi:MAG: winged helix DNA-binding domain-containing protein [Chloroflexota bacterium]
MPRAVYDALSLQAQDWPAAALGVRARTVGITAANVERALAEERSIVRAWLMRGTLHLVATEDYRWLLPLFGPVLIPGDRGRKAELGLDEATLAACVRAIPEILAGQGPAPRSTIVEALGRRGIRLDGQAGIHAIQRAALEGIVCRGPDRARKPTFVLTADWMGSLQPLPPDAALAELAYRYLRAFGPATPEDFAYWSGLPVGMSRQGWGKVAERLVRLETGSGHVWLPGEHADWLEEPPPAEPQVRLVPSFDSYLLAYRDRTLAVAAEHDQKFRPGGGLLRPLVLVDGLAAGSWRTEKRRESLLVTVEPFAELPSKVGEDIEREVADIGRFLGVEAELALV